MPVGLCAVVANLGDLQPLLRFLTVELEVAFGLVQRNLGALEFQVGCLEVTFQRVDLQFGNHVALLDLLVAFEEDRANVAVGAEEEIFFHHGRDTPGELCRLDHLARLHLVCRF